MNAEASVSPGPTTATDFPLWTMMVIRGALLLSFGLFALFFPFTTLFSITVAIAFLILGDGLISLWRGLRRLSRSIGGAGSWLLRGAVALLLGLGLLFVPLVATFAFAALALAIIGAWLIWLGVVDLRIGLRAGEPMTIWWSALFLLCGGALVVLLFSTPGSMLALAWLLAIAALFGGVTMVSRGLLLRAAVEHQ